MPVSSFFLFGFVFQLCTYTYVSVVCLVVINVEMVKNLRWSVSTFQPFTLQQ